MSGFTFTTSVIFLVVYSFLFRNTCPQTLGSSPNDRVPNLFQIVDEEDRLAEVMRTSSLSSNPSLVFFNPLLSRGYSSYEITQSGFNRCMQYLRCLLFGCCDSELESFTHEYFQRESSVSFSTFSCMFSSNFVDNINSKKSPTLCSYSTSLSERIGDHWLMNTTITSDISSDQLVRLPPTPPEVYSRLSLRREY